MTSEPALVRLTMFQILFFNNLFAPNADVDECATGNGGCLQYCTNTPGSYNCNCTLGFALSADDRTCNGKYTKGIVCVYRESSQYDLLM